MYCEETTVRVARVWVSEQQHEVRGDWQVIDGQLKDHDDMKKAKMSHGDTHQLTAGSSGHFHTATP